MKHFRWLTLAIALTLLVGCSTGDGGPLFASATATLPPPFVGITPAPEATGTLYGFLDGLKGNDYAGMYGLLDRASQAAITQDDFIQRYRDVLNAMSAASLDYEAVSVVPSPALAQATFRITYHSTLAGDIARDFTATLNLEDGLWRLAWDPSLILPELAGGNRLGLDCAAPARGDIYDRDGEPLVYTTEAAALGVDTTYINYNTLTSLTTELGQLVGVNPEIIENQIIASGPGWYIGVGTTTPAEGERLLGMGFDALVINRYTSRYYANSGSASQVLGYTLSISPENKDVYQRRGYCLNDRIGYAGIERVEESALAGKHGGTLYVVGPQGQILSQLAKVEPQPASSVYLTLDKNLQYQAERAISGFTGAVVVIERDTGRVLAMASSPGFDSNLFDPQNYNNYVNNGAMLNNLLSDPERPLLNRAAQGQYPLGSVFKVITFSAALESGLYLPETTYDCQYDFSEIAGIAPKHDWTWEHCQDRLRRGLFCDTADSTPSGLITLSDGLMRSCNPYFWHIGLDLFRSGRPNDIANMARAFGLGSPTGIEIDEEAGAIIDPTDEIAATNQAIGQGDVLVTPLQVARFMAAIGNGGTMYRPHIIEKIVGPDGQVTYAFAPDPIGKLPIQPDRLKALQDAMVMVVRGRRGTANFRIGSFSIPIAGKTGTAESSNPGYPHAWFAGYTFFNEEDSKLKNIAIAVVLENAGEGSDYAAPVFRRIVEAYIYGHPQTLYWFESNYGVTRTPTPFGGIPTNTPKPK